MLAELKPLNVEQLDDRIRKASEIAQYGIDWLSRDKRSFVERYFKNDMKLALRRLERMPSYNGVLLEALPDGWKSDALLHRRRIDRDAGGQEVNVNEPRMLPNYVELVESKDGVIPSTVRLQRFNDGSFALGQPLVAFPSINTVDGVDGTLLARVNWKVSVLTWSFAVAHSQRSGEQVEATADAVNDDARFSIDEGGQRFDISEFENGLIGLRVLLSHDSIRLVGEPNSDALLNTRELGYGPVNGGLGV